MRNGELVDTLVIAGTPEECRARIAEYAGLVDELLLLLVAVDVGVDDEVQVAVEVLVLDAVAV